MAKDELETMIVFDIVNDEWARTVHQHSSRQKKGAHFVERLLFPRDSRTMLSGETLSSFFEAQTNEGNQWIEFSTDPIFILLHLI